MNRNMIVIAFAVVIALFTALPGSVHAQAAIMGAPEPDTKYGLLSASETDGAAATDGTVEPDRISHNDPCQVAPGETEGGVDTAPVETDGTVAPDSQFNKF